MLHVYDNKVKVFDTSFSYLDWLQNFKSVNSMKILAQTTTVYFPSMKILAQNTIFSFPGLVTEH